MKKDIPLIQFNPANNDNFGLEIVALDRIAQHKNKYEHDPELPHQLKFYNLIFFTNGEGRHFIDFEWYPVQKDSLIYITKGQVNAFDFSKNLRGYCIIFTEDYFVKSFSHLPKNIISRLFTPQLFSPVLSLPKSAEFEQYVNLLKKESSVETDNRDLITESLFVILLSKAEHYRQHQSRTMDDSPKIQLFQRFNKLLEEKFTETRSADFYAAELAITYKHLNSVCKELVDKTAKTVIDDFIILRAKRKLINSGIKSTELAYELGFEDPTNFTKYFKKSTGLTPKVFKKSYSSF